MRLFRVNSGLIGSACGRGTVGLGGCSRAESGVPVGVLFDYFRAPDASTASLVLERVGGPTTPDLDAPVLDAVAGKGFEPEVMMRTLQSLLTGVPYDDLPGGELLAMEGEDGPWIIQLSEELRDALADAQLSRLPAVAEQWVRTEEFWDQATATEVLPFLDEVTALARRAQQAGERLYCWMCL
jgi:hypothetical protein